MKTISKSHWNNLIALLLAVLLASVLVGGSVLAQEQEQARGVIGDNNPAIAVAQKTENSVVGVITNATNWRRGQGENSTQIAQGSGVVIEPGYVLTNAHVIEQGNTYEVALPSGETTQAKLVGSDFSTDLAVLKVDSSELTPVKVGISSDLLVGSTVIAIGNPGGTVLANTVTSGIVSALERTSVNAQNASRAISYIQHDASINSGNSGGGLFNINGELVGINTLKYLGSGFSQAAFEGLGFAIPIDMAYPIARDLIQFGKVQRPQMGVMVQTIDGPEQPINTNPPASVGVMSLNENSPAQRAGLRQFDFITEIDGVRVKSLQELTTQMDQHKAGDTVKITVARYDNAEALLNSLGYLNGNQSGGDNSPYGGGYGYNDPFGGFFGGRRGPSYYNPPANVVSDFETLTFDVTLEVLK
ncbi:S1C family serine protease [Bacillota bacterium Meth-B3]|nr:trypsin-like peptidase domain-containing protein [Christensenellaceae bacterium]